MALRVAIRIRMMTVSATLLASDISESFSDAGKMDFSSRAMESAARCGAQCTIVRSLWSRVCQVELRVAGRMAERGPALLPSEGIVGPVRA